MVCVAFVLVPERSIVKAADDAFITIMKDGSVLGTDKIVRIGNTYTFVDDINTGEARYGIEIMRDNVVIDGAGHTLEGKFNRTALWNHTISRYGIRTSNKDCITIKNLNIKKYGDGICHFLSSYGNIINNNITDCGGGILIYNSINNTLSSNSLVNNTEHFEIHVDSFSDYNNDIDTSNTMDGKPFYYWINQSDRTVPTDAAFVFLIQCTNITISNIEFSGNDQNIFLKATTNCTIYNNTIIGSGKNRGIELENSNNNKIFNNTIKNQNFGVLLESSVNNVIDKNHFTDDGVGIKLTGSYNTTVFSNIITKTVEGIYFAEFNSEPPTVSYSVTGNIISGNQIADGTNGITAHGNNVVDKNRILGNSGTAIKVDKNTTVTNNVVFNCGTGIVVTKSYNFMKNNTIANTGYSFFFPELHSDYWRMNYVNVIINDIDESNTIDGKPVCYWVNKQDETVPENAGYVILVKCNNVTVQNLNFTSNKEGIILLGTKNSTVFRNWLSENSIGLGIFHSDNNTVSENIIKNNDAGIRIGDSKYNTITFNNITNNTWGIDFKGSQTNNTIYCNNFVENGVAGTTLQVSINKLYGAGLGNFWDNGTIGNYWSDYKIIHADATQINGTTVGNIPFYINENNQDNYPLMEETNIPEFSLWSILPVLIATTATVIIWKHKIQKAKTLRR